MKKILVLDGIGGISLGKEINDSFNKNDVESHYYNLNDLTRKRFYKFRGSIAKSINKLTEKEEFYHFPKILEKNVLNIFEKEKPEGVFIIGFFYKFIAPKFMKELKDKFGFRLFLYDTDSCNLYSRRREFIFFLEKELTIYDKIFSFSKVSTEFFKNTLKLPAIFFPFGANPIHFQNFPDKSIEVLFVGTADLRRVFLLEKINDYISVYGKRWERHKPLISHQLKSRINFSPVWGSELYKLLFNSKIILNITRSDFFAAETGLNLRIFEALAAGCFLLTDYCDEINDVFEIGQDLETYKSGDELKEKVNYYLKNDDKRKIIAQKGHQKFLENFTWDKRIKKLCEDENWI